MNLESGLKDLEEALPGLSPSDAERLLPALREWERRVSSLHDAFVRRSEF